MCRWGCVGLLLSVLGWPMLLYGAIFETQHMGVIVGEVTTPLSIAVALGGVFEVPPQEMVSMVGDRFAFTDGSVALKTIRAALVAIPDSGPADTMPAQVTPPGGLSSGLSTLDDATFINSIGMVFVLIPAGEFMMGSNAGDYDEKPVHQVRISQPFYLGKYEVTQGQWHMVMGSNPSHFAGDPNLPVEQVSWEEVQTFVRTLNAREGVTAYRLPAEAEWEYAARAGSTTTYGFGNKASKLGDYAWYGDNAGGRTHPVGQRRPNAWGLYDMHGNVWEWVQDWYGPYDVDAVTDPQGGPADSYRVYRGGGWGTFAGNCRSADRNFDMPNTRLAGLGFRLLRAAR